MMTKQSRIHPRSMAGLVTKLRLTPPSDEAESRNGKASLLGDRSAVAAKTASKAERATTCGIRDDIGFRRCLGLAALVVATSSCGNVVRDGRSPVFLVIDSLQAAPTGGFGANTFQSNLFSDVQVLITEPAPCAPATPCPTTFADTGQAALRIALKDIGTTAAPTAPTSNNEVTVTRYRVEYRRADGRNVPGTDVPYGFDGAATATVPVGGTTTVGFELVRHVAKAESPLVQLIANRNVIAAIADVTFWGKDRVGNEITVTGSISIEFGNFGDG